MELDKEQLLESMNTRLDWMVNSTSIDFTCVNANFFSDVQKMLLAKNYGVIQIDLKGIASSKEAFFRIVSNLPTDPEYQGLHDGYNAAALDDSLWGGLSFREDMAIVLHNAEKMIDEYLNILLLLFEHLTSTACAKKAKDKDRKGKLKIFAFGEGHKFARLSVKNGITYIEL